MITLATVPMINIVSYGRRLLNQHREGHPSFEDAAQAIALAIHNDFRETDNRPTFSFVWIYRLCRQNDLPASAHPFVRSYKEGFWLALAGCASDEAGWSHRLEAPDWQLITAGATMHPMAREAFSQLHISPGVSGEELADDGTGTLLIRASMLMHTFYVPDAVNSTAIPSIDFIRQYNIHSIVGIGTPFRSGSAYILLGMAGVSINAEAAKKFSKISPFISSLLDGYDSQNVIWREAP